MSLYDYCSGDPVNGLDPTGRCLSKQLENPENTASWFDQGTNFGQAADGGEKSGEIGRFENRMANHGSAAGMAAAFG